MSFKYGEDQGGTILHFCLSIQHFWFDGGKKRVICVSDTSGAVYYSFKFLNHENAIERPRDTENKRWKRWKQVQLSEKRARGQRTFNLSCWMRKIVLFSVGELRMVRESGWWFVHQGRRVGETPARLGLIQGSCYRPSRTRLTRKHSNGRGQHHSWFSLEKLKDVFFSWRRRV